MIQKILFLLLSICISIGVFAQDDTLKPDIFLEAEILVGKLVPHAPNFPDSPLSGGLFLNVGKWNTAATEGWESFYKHPQYGLSLGCQWFGNKEILGQQYTLAPYFIMPTRRDWSKGVQFRFALGANYYTTHFDEIENPENDFIGSPFTWSFQVGMQKTWFANSNLNIKTGMSLYHASNGHTTIPNFGLNSLMASVSFQYSKNGRPQLSLENKVYKNSEKHYYIQVKQSYGFHELGGTIKPTGGKNYGVFHTSIAGGILFKKHMLLRSGFAFRHYRSYHNYIVENNLPEYIDTPILSASSLTVFVGNEFLMGHFSIDMEIGINIYKPFYKTHWEVFEQTNQFDKLTKRFITTKTGVNIYLFNTKNLPKHNISVGAFINANYGQADFTEFSMGYTYQLKYT